MRNGLIEQMTSIRNINIFGERCSGTNYLEQLIKSNLETIQLSSAYGYKHFFPQKEITGLKKDIFIIIYRDPFNWLRSFYRNPWHVAPELQNMPFSDFIRNEWKCVWDKHSGKSEGDELYGTEMLFERDPATGERFGNILKMRSAKVAAFETIREKTPYTYYMKYEDLNSDPEHHVRCISNIFSIPMTNTFSHVTTYKGQKWYQSWKTKFFRKGLPTITREDIAYIVEQLDEKLELSIGYDIKDHLIEPNV